MFILRGSLSLAAYIPSLSTINVNYWTHLVLKNQLRKAFICVSRNLLKFGLGLIPDKNVPFVAKYPYPE